MKNKDNVLDNMAGFTPLSEKSWIKDSLANFFEGFYYSMQAILSVAVDLFYVVFSLSVFVSSVFLVWEITFSKEYCDCISLLVISAVYFAYYRIIYMKGSE